MIRRSSTTPPAPPAWRRALSTPTATSSATSSSMPRRPRRRGLPRYGRVGLGRRHLPARPVAARRDPVRLPARGRVRPAQAARLPLPPPGSQRVHDADRDAGDDGRRGRRRRYPQTSGSSAAPASRSTRRRSAGFASSTGVTVLDYYGLTESYPLCANCPFMEVREGSMGRPMPGWDVRILDEDENPVEQGERGEICLRARSNPHTPSATGTCPRRVTRRSGASGSTLRTPPSRTPTATTGTPGAPTT